MYRLGSAKATLLGTVMAPNRATALAMAYVEFGIPEGDRKRIVVHPVSDA